MDLVSADDIKLSVIPKGILWFRIIQPLMTSWLCCVLEQDHLPLRIHETRDQTERILQLLVILNILNVVLNGFDCVLVLGETSNYMFKCRVSNWGLWFALCFAVCLFYFHVRSPVKWTCPSSVVKLHSAALPSLCGEGAYPAELVEQRRLCLFSLFYYSYT